MSEWSNLFFNSAVSFSFKNRTIALNELNENRIPFSDVIHENADVSYTRIISAGQWDCAFVSGKG